MTIQVSTCLQRILQFFKWRVHSQTRSVQCSSITFSPQSNYRFFTSCGFDFSIGPIKAIFIVRSFDIKWNFDCLHSIIFLSPYHAYTGAHTHSPSLSLSFSCSHTHTHTDRHKHAHTYTHGVGFVGAISHNISIKNLFQKGTGRLDGLYKLTAVALSARKQGKLRSYATSTNSSNFYLT